MNKNLLRNKLFKNSFKCNDCTLNNKLFNNYTLLRRFSETSYCGLHRDLLTKDTKKYHHQTFGNDFRVPFENNFDNNNNNNKGRSPYCSKISNIQLFRYFLVSLFASSKGLLKIATRCLPFIPNVFIKEFLYPIYCGGENPKEVVKTIEELQKNGFAQVLLSYSVENAEETPKSKNINKEEVSIASMLKQSVDDIFINSNCTKENPGLIVIKPSGMTNEAANVLRNYNSTDKNIIQEKEKYLESIRSVCKHVEMWNNTEKGKGRCIVMIDAEKYNMQNGVYDTQREMMKEFNKNGNIIVEGTIQMYLKDSIDVLKKEIKLAREGNYKLGFKLVRGAYIESEPNRDRIIFNKKSDTDNCYNEGVRICIEDASDVVKKLIVATHNRESMKKADSLLFLRESKGLENNHNDKRISFAQLMGMCDDDAYFLINNKRPVYKYVPWGPVPEMKEYLRRRLVENGSSVSQRGREPLMASLREIRYRLRQRV